MAAHISDMCRLCMSKTNVNMYIFKPNLFEIVNWLLPKKVTENDDMPNYICDECDSKLNIISKFRDTVRNADLQFRLLISGKCANAQNDEGTIKKLHGTKDLLSTEDVIQGLLQIKGLTVKKMPGSSNHQKVTRRKSMPINYKAVETINDLNIKLSNSGVIIKKIARSNMRGSSCNATCYLPENDVNNLIEEDSMTNDEHETDSDLDCVSVDRNDDFGQVTNGRQFYNKAHNKDTIIKDTIINNDSQKTKLKGSTKKDTPVIEIKTTSTYVCKSCQTRFRSYDELKEHMRTNDICKNVRLTCETCGKIVKDRKAMYQHSLTHKEKQRYVCEECGKTYTNIFSMENHKAIMHGDKEELTGSVYKCKVCNETFAKRKDLFLHVNKHTKEQVHLCDTCGKCFSTEDNLRSHLRTHSDARPYACENCDKRFRTRLALVQHSHRHTGIKPFVCDICGKTFAKKCSLTSHVRLHSGEVIMYECHICLEQFSSNGKLKTHIKFHPA